MPQDNLNSENVISNEQTQQYVNYIMAIEKNLNTQKTELKTQYVALVKKNNLVQDALIVLSCFTSAGFFTFLAAQVVVLTYITGTFTAISTILSLLSTRWKYGDAVTNIGKIYNQLDAAVDEFGYLRLRLGTSEWTSSEVMAYLEKLNKEVDALEDLLQPYEIVFSATEEPAVEKRVMKMDPITMSPSIGKMAQNDEIMDALKGFFKK